LNAASTAEIEHHAAGTVSKSAAGAQAGIGVNREIPTDEVNAGIEDRAACIRTSHADTPCTLSDAESGGIKAGEEVSALNVWAK
jgi:hypothetical protein